MGAAINAGAWVGSTFDSTAPQTLKALMNAKVLDSQKTTDTTGAKVAPSLKIYIRAYMVMDFFLDTSCRRNASAYMASHYPWFMFTSQGGMPVADCAAAAQRIADLRARAATNKSSTMK